MSFEYRDGCLMVEDLPLADIAAKMGTPLYVYSEAVFKANVERFKKAFEKINPLICMAVKVLDNSSILSLGASLGLGADIVSGGELFKVMRSGIDTTKVIYSGVGKTQREMKEALSAGILMFNIESEEEMETLAKVAAEEAVQAQVAIRLNPDVDPGTHSYIATGLKESKFGVSIDEAFRLYKKIASKASLLPVGVACHIGSQILSPAPFLEAATKMKEMALRLKGEGIPLKYFDMGGGYGIAYSKTEQNFPLSEYAEGLAKIMGELKDMRLILEPGRYLGGNSAVMLAEVLYNKRNGDKNFVVCDGAMNDLLRPSLYGAEHEILPLCEDFGDKIKVDVVGPVCESADFLGKERLLPMLKGGDLLAVMNAGAYCATMSSNYNSRPRAAQVLVSGSDFKLIKKRENYEDLIAGEN